jgi:hypothetical protein
MDSPKRTARLAGLLYLLSSIPGAFAFLYVPGKLVVEGNPTATADRLRAFPNLLRLGIGAEMLGMTLFIFLALVLYRLFRPTSPEPALWMLVLILLPMPISFLGVVPEVAALNLAGGEGGTSDLSIVGSPQRDALAYLCLDLHDSGIMVAQVFWGLWLFPFAICVFRSGFIPRFLGVLLVLAGCGHLAHAVGALVFPRYLAAVGSVTGILTKGELLMILWLLIWGARPRPAPEATS